MFIWKLLLWRVEFFRGASNVVLCTPDNTSKHRILPTFLLAKEALQLEDESLTLYIPLLTYVVSYLNYFPHVIFLLTLDNLCHVDEIRYFMLLRVEEINRIIKKGRHLNEYTLFLGWLAERIFIC